MVNKELIPKEKFKLMVLIPEFSDDQVYKSFLDLEITCEEDIDEVIGILSWYRADILKRIKLPAQ